MKNLKTLLIVPFIAVWLSVIPGGEICLGDESNQMLFLKRTFKYMVPKPNYLWITPTVRPILESILLHEYKGLRVKYWRKEDKVVWILEETAKDATICAGIVISHGKIQMLEILSAEGRYGSLIKNDKFTSQFQNVGANEDKRLTRSIDGISGATISVNTISRLAQLALALDEIQRAESK